MKNILFAIFFAMNLISVSAFAKEYQGIIAPEPTIEGYLLVGDMDLLTPDMKEMVYGRYGPNFNNIQELPTYIHLTEGNYKGCRVEVLGQMRI